MNKQRRRRWCDSVLEAPGGYKELLEKTRQQQIASNKSHSSSCQAANTRNVPATSDAATIHTDPELLLLEQLSAFASRPHQHGDLAPVKDVLAAAEALANDCPASAPAWHTCMQLLYEVLFMHSSRPLHKQLLSLIRRVPFAHQQVIQQVLLALVIKQASYTLVSGSASNERQKQHQQQQQLWELLQPQLGACCTSDKHSQQHPTAADWHLPNCDAEAILSAPCELPAAATDKGLDLAQAAISLLQMPGARDWLQPAAAVLLLAIARAVQTTLNFQKQQQQQSLVCQMQQQQQQQKEQQAAPHSVGGEQHLTPKRVELLQDAINVMYMVLQNHGQHMAAAATAVTAGLDALAPLQSHAGDTRAVAHAAICEAASSMLCALQGCLVVREALASAAVVVWSAAVLPNVCPTAAALVIAAGLTPHHLASATVKAAASTLGCPTDCYAGVNLLAAGELEPTTTCAAGTYGSNTSVGMVSSCSAALLKHWRAQSLLEQQLLRQGTTLAAELQKAPPVAAVCALRGLLAALPASALAGDLGAVTTQQQQQQGLQQDPTASAECSNNGTDSCSGTSTSAPSHTNSGSGTGSTGCLLMQCALPFAVEAVKTATDAHFKFFALSLITAALKAASHLWGMVQEQSCRQDSQLTTAPAPSGGNDAAKHQVLATLPNPEAAGVIGAANAAEAAVSQIDGGHAAGDPDSWRPQSNSATCRESGRLLTPWLHSDDAVTMLGVLTMYLDEPVAPVLAKTQEAFEALLTLIKCQQEARAMQQQQHQTAGAIGASIFSMHWGAEGAALGAATQQTAQNRCGHDPTGILEATTQSVLAMDVSRKGRYQPLVILLPHVGAAALLQLQPNLVAQTLQALQSNLAASAAAGFFKALLLQLRKELSHSPAAGTSTAPAAAGSVTEAAAQQPGDPCGTWMQHIPADMKPWCLFWLTDLLTVLVSKGERTRMYAANYALPMVLQIEPLLLQPLVDTIMAMHAAVARQSAATGQPGLLDSCRESPGSRCDAPAALVVVLRTARRLQLLGNLDVLLTEPDHEAAEQLPGVPPEVPVYAAPAALLLSAVSSASAALRTEALELVCVSARTTAPPGKLELLIAQRWLELCLRCTGADSRHKSLALWEKLLARQAAAVRAIRHRTAAAHSPGATGGAHPKALPRASRCLMNSSSCSLVPAEETEAEAEQRQLCFLDWISTTLLSSLYPGAPYERKYYALQLLVILLQQWQPQQLPKAASSPAAIQPELFLARLLSPACVQTLIWCVVDSWDKMRMAASRVLELMPSPLPGCHTMQQLQQLLAWAQQLLQSPRVRDADAGARMLQVLVVKYLIGQGVPLQVLSLPTVENTPAAQQDAIQRSMLGNDQHTSSSNMCSSATEQLPFNAAHCAAEQQVTQAAATLLSSLSTQLRNQLHSAHADIAAASRHGLFHGTLLCLRYVAEVLPWSQLASSTCDISLQVPAAAAAACRLPCTSGSSHAADAACNILQDSHSNNSCSCNTDHKEASDGSLEHCVWVSGPAPEVLHCWVADLVSLITAVAQLVQPLLSAQDINMAAGEVEEVNEDADEATALDSSGEGDIYVAIPAAAAKAAAFSGIMPGPAVQLLISACWTTWKEASSLIGTLACRIPLPRVYQHIAKDTTTSTIVAISGRHNSGWQPQIIEWQQLEQLGALQLSMLLSMKHNGAVEKSQAGFVTLVERLLESSEQCLNQLPKVWLGKCLARVLQEGQCRDDIVRRSAGLPYAICSLFLAEPVGVPKQLLPSGLQQLLSIASNEGMQEPWPRVHAFNTLRVVFNDSNMAMDSSGHHAQGVVVAINGMTAPAWEVRNAAALTFTALVLRIVGARNIDAQQQKLLKPLNQLAATPPGLHTGNSSPSIKCASAPVQGPTAADFFSRYPQLHNFLMQKLQDALHQQCHERGAGGTSSRSAATVPPSLFPALILLSRLRPQLLLSTTDDHSNHKNPGSTEATDQQAATAMAALKVQDPAVFVPAVLAVGQSAVLGVRKMAAAALAPVVPSAQLHPICLHLARLLAAPAAATAVDHGVHQGVDAVHDSIQTVQHLQTDMRVPPEQQQQQQPVSLSQNALHGTLLQLTALLAAVSSSCLDQGSTSKNCAAVVALVQQLVPLFVDACWIVSPGSSSSRVCCAVQQAFLAAAGQLLVLVYKQWPYLMQCPQQQKLSKENSTHETDSNNAQQTAEARCLKVPVQLPLLVSLLRRGCCVAVRATMRTAQAVAGLTRQVGFKQQQQQQQQQDPAYCCWARDSAALLLGPVLQIEVMLQDLQQQQQQHGKDGNQCPDKPLVAVQLLAELLPSCLDSSMYEVKSAALKACAVQLERALLILEHHSSHHQSSPASKYHDNSSPPRAALLLLSSRVWTALKHEKLVKNVQRLLRVWGLLQELQQQLFGEVVPLWQFEVDPPSIFPATVAAVATTAGPYRLASTVDSHLAQLAALVQIARSYREPAVMVAAILCAARVAGQVVVDCITVHSSSCVSTSAHAAPGLAASGNLPSASDVQLLTDTVNVMDVFSKPCQPEQLRAAAAKALQLSGVLLLLVQAAADDGTKRDVNPRHKMTGDAHPSIPAAPANPEAVSYQGAVQPAAGDGADATPSSVPSGLVSLAVSAWSLALRLMEDEEEDVRKAAAAAAQHALQMLPKHNQQQLSASQVDVNKVMHASATAAAADKNTCSAEQPLLQDRNRCGVFNGTDHADNSTVSEWGGARYVSAVQGDSFAFLGRCGGQLSDFAVGVLEFLAATVFVPESPMPSVLQKAQQLTGPKMQDALQTPPAATRGLPTEELQLPSLLTRRLFEREDDNHHEEPLLLAQHAALALQQALLLQRKQEQLQQPGGCTGRLQHDARTRYAVDTVLSRWASCMLHQLAPGNSSLDATNAWAADVTCAEGIPLPEVYGALYRCFLGLWSLQPWLGCGSVAASDSELVFEQHGSGMPRTALKAAACRMAALLLRRKLPQDLHDLAKAVLEPQDVGCSALFLLH